MGSNLRSKSQIDKQLLAGHVKMSGDDGLSARFIFTLGKDIMEQDKRTSKNGNLSR